MKTKNYQPMRRIILGINCEGIYNQFLSGFGEEFESDGWRTGKDVKDYIETEIKGLNLLLPAPLRSLDFKLVYCGKSFSGEISIKARKIKDAGWGISRILEIEAERRGLLWTPTKAASGEGYLFPNKNIEPHETRQFIASTTSDYNKEDRTLEHFVRVGGAYGAKILCLGEIADFKRRTAPIQWISETIINTYIEIAKRRRLETIDERMYPLRINITN